MNKIIISEIEIIPVKPRNGLVGFASCVVNNQFYLGNIAIYTSPNGKDYRLVYPSKTLPNGKQIQCVHPINRETGEAMREGITEKFQELMDKVTTMQGGCNEKVKSDIHHN